MGLGGQGARRRTAPSTAGGGQAHLTEVDNAGRYRTEVLGNDVTTERTYFAAQQRLKSITTENDAATVQSLSYDVREQDEPGIHGP